MSPNQPATTFEKLRLAEIGDAIELLRRHGFTTGDLLEIGAGTGWQAKALSEAGFSVEAIDLPPDDAISSHASNRHWPIRDYDGVHIPYPDDSFDIIYSSNVLEHVADLDALTEEMKRVLRPDGIALHLLPNPQWRMLSLLTYFPGQAIDLVRYLRKRSRRAMEDVPSPVTAAIAADKTLFWTKAAKRLLPPTHGAVGNPLSELGRFSQKSWDSYFDRRGWDIVHHSNNGLIASGDYLLGPLLGMDARRRLGEAFGGIAHIYLIRPAGGERSD